jgi:four helix bundle protein
MGVRRFEDLVVWQLAHELQEEVFAFTAMLPTLRDVNYCDQIRESTRSVTRNIAEGFGRYEPREPPEPSEPPEPI